MVPDMEPLSVTCVPVLWARVSLPCRGWVLGKSSHRVAAVSFAHTWSKWWRQDLNSELLPAFPIG